MEQEKPKPDDDPKKPWWQKLLLILVAVLAAAISKTIVQHIFQEANKPSRSDFEAGLDKFMSDPKNGPFYRELRISFPDDYAQVRAQMTNIALDGNNRDQIQIQTAMITRRFMLTHKSDTIKAPAANLFELGKAQASLMNDLKAHYPEACAGYTMTGAIKPSNFSPQTIALLGEVGAAQVRAIRHGIDTPTERPEALTEAEQTAFYKAVSSQGISAELLKKVFSDGLNNASITEQCDAGNAIYGGIANLPPDTAADVLVVLLTAK